MLGGCSVCPSTRKLLLQNQHLVEVLSWKDTVSYMILFFNHTWKNKQVLVHLDAILRGFCERKCNLSIQFSKLCISFLYIHIWMYQHTRKVMQSNIIAPKSIQQHSFKRSITASHFFTIFLFFFNHPGNAALTLPNTGNQRWALSSHDFSPVRLKLQFGRLKKI